MLLLSVMLPVMLPCTAYCRGVLTLMTLLPPLAPALLLLLAQGLFSHRPCTLQPTEELAVCCAPALLCGLLCCAMHLSPLPPAAALQNSCDPLGMCLGNYRPDRTRGPKQELGEAQAEGGPRLQSPWAGTVGH